MVKLGVQQPLSLAGLPQINRGLRISGKKPDEKLSRTQR